MKAWTLILTMLLLAACKKEDSVDSVPEIELLDVTPLEVVQFEENVSITIKYTDGDGDLGFPDPDVHALQVKDSRLNAADWYHVPPLAPLESEVAIEGQLTVQLSTLFLIGNGAQEVTTYAIRMRDRAGNFSNEVITPEILINDSL